MIEFPSVQKEVIRHHYDISTLFYWLLWGPHIHHGYWEGQESPRVAQIQLTEKLANLADIRPGGVVYDIGCGMGGSSQWLARHRSCQVTGVTLSHVQQLWAASSARLNRVSPSPKFLCEDAEKVELGAGSADFVWSIECTEHLFDKAAFFKKAANWLKPSGRFALCAWLAKEDPVDAIDREQVERVCDGMFCPSLGSQSDYVKWFEDAGMRIVKSGIWTRQVERTWQICKARVERTGVRYIARLLGKNHLLFLNQFEAILNAYKSGAMEYGYFVAEKKV